MKSILVLGAGLVTPPLVRYLLEKTEFVIKVADVRSERAHEVVGNHPRGEALALDANDETPLDAAVRDADVVVSLLPPPMHPQVARLCLRHRRHLVTASYAGDEMRALDREAAAADVLLLNEVGVDPGLDHMSAKQIIDGVQSAGGRVRSFKSYCGGLPAPGDVTTPWGYKFSWSPRGVVVAARARARYRKGGEIIDIPSWDLFTAVQFLLVDGVGFLEAYPNRDSLHYIDLYGLGDIETMYRGTLRYPGHCATWCALSRAGMLDMHERVGMAETSHAELIGEICHGRPDRAKRAFARKARLTEHSDPIARLEWLGLFSDEKLGAEQISPLDVLANLLQKKLLYSEGEKDMVILHHEFEIEQDGRRELVTSQLVEFASEGGASAMSRTVGLPAAVATRLVCEGKVSARGLCIPVNAEIYKPILDALAAENITFSERRRPLG